MAQCVAVANVSGTDVLVPSSADPCTGLVVLTPSEYSAWVVSPLNLSAEEGAALSVAILAVWSVAWAARALVRALGTDGEALD